MLRVILRRFGRHKMNTALHIVGLTLGMSVCLVIGLFLRHELSFDSYHKKAKRTYRINSVFIDNNGENYHYSTPVPLAEELKTTLPGLENVVLSIPTRGNVIEINPEKRFIQEYVMCVNDEFPEVFQMEPLTGSTQKSLSKPFQAILTESTAKKFFGQEDALGKTFKLNNRYNITVTSVIRDLPPNTHLPATVILSYIPDQEFLGVGPDAWTYVSGSSVFVTLPDGFDIQSLETRLNAIADAKINPTMPESMRSRFEVQPLGLIHFDAKYGGGGEWVNAVNKLWLWFFAAIGLAVLALACINFVNLSTAQALARAREIGVRKSVGARKVHLIGQFMLEAWVLATAAAILSITIVQLVMPSINILMEKTIPFDLLGSPILMVSLAGGVMLTGLMAGLYPAFVIARFNPAVTLKSRGHTSGDNGSVWLRKALLVTQFTISAGLVVIVLLMSLQLNFLRSKSLGFNKDNVIYFEFKDPRKAGTFTAELGRIPSVKDVSFSSATPSSRFHWGTGMSLTDIDDPKRTSTTLILGDDHYCTMYGLKLLSGRLPLASDTNSLARSLPAKDKIHKVIVNEKLVQTLGFASNEKAIGKTFWMGFNAQRAEIIGVVANFNTSSLHESIKPAFITPGEWYQIAGIKIEANADIPSTLAAIEDLWQKTYPDGVFDYKFLDEQIDAFYKSETQLYMLFKIFAGLAMLISCLGLWGLMSLAAQQRVRELGIRKALGASITDIVTLLSKDFMALVILSLIIATPLTWYGMNEWLGGFAYHIDVTWIVFALAAAISITISSVTVGVQALRAALVNPVDSLRTE